MNGKKSAEEKEKGKGESGWWWWLRGEMGSQLTAELCSFHHNLHVSSKHACSR
jgi:hypothetical protein